ncbi:MAG: hypothetical protein M3P84_09140 [Chloroflexota bacterium]|nr:hypothetical protein [Chloroflexota bacterium]
MGPTRPAIPPGDHWLRGMEIVGYHDLDRRPGFKMAIQEVAGRWYLYVGHLWEPGWSILDVTDPSRPGLIRFLPGPTNTWTIQVQVAGGRMITALEKIDTGWGEDPDAPFEEGLLIWDVSDPADPVQLGQHKTGGNGTHRNFFDGGRFVHTASARAGFAGHIYEIVDLADPRSPQAVGRWWVPGQRLAGDEQAAPEGTSLHAPYIVGERAYLAYGGAGLVILDIADPSSPALVSRLDFAPPFTPIIATHSAVPLVGRDLIAVNSEAIEEDCAEPLGFAGLVDIVDERAPRVVSMFPLPGPPPDAPYRNFCERGGRFGPHNLHQSQANPALLARDDLALLTWFNAGLRAYDIADPRLPREIGEFVPPDPVERRGILPAGRLTAQSEDVLADRRGNIFVTDKNHGVYVLRLAG